MTWKKLLTDRCVAPEPAGKQELDDLRAMISVNLQDARVRNLSSQGRFEFAYNAARLLATMLVRASGFRVTSRAGHHYFTFQALRAVDSCFAKTAVYLDSARDRRNEFSYDSPAPVSDTDADELLDAAEQFGRDVEKWIKTHHPALA